MIYLLASVSRGAEFRTADAINDLGALAVSPRKVDMIRLPKQRRPQLVESPVFSNYLFCALTDHDYHRARLPMRFMGEVVQPIRPVRVITPGEWWGNVQCCLQRIEIDYQRRMEQYEAGVRLEEYQPGDALQILAGIFEGKAASFRRLIDGKVPMIEAELMDLQILGRSVTVTVDPIKARRIAAE